MIEKSNDVIRKTVLMNTVKMLTNRKWLPLEDLNKNIEKVTKTVSEDNNYFVTKDIVIRMINNIKLSKLDQIRGFVEKHTQVHKIIIVKSVVNKLQENIYSDYKNVEFFREEEMMINIVDCPIVPKHEVLTEKEGEEILESYNINRSKMASMLVTDTIARYYRMKKGDICRIIRHSETAGYVPYYRKVI